jgi:hypothetical protein
MDLGPRLEDPRLVLQWHQEGERPVDRVKGVRQMANAEGLPHGRPSRGGVFLKIDLDGPAFLDAPLQERRLIAECPALDRQRLVVGEQAQRLPGQDLLAQFDLQLLDLERRRE